jgi:hypothetical protein
MRLLIPSLRYLVIPYILKQNYTHVTKYDTP